MDVVRHQIAQSLVDHTLRRDARQTSKTIRDHQDLKMSAACLGSGVTFVEGALVDDRDMLCLKTVAESVLDRLHSSR